MQIDLCSNGLDAIEAIKLKRYDLVFMDHKMPGMDGIETTAHIRALGDETPYYKNVPIIALTANAISGTREMFLESGFDDFLSKPIDITVLNTILEKWIPKEKWNISKEECKNTMEKTDTDRIAEDMAIEGLNVKKGILASGGKHERYLKILSSFYREGIEKSQELKTFLETGDMSFYKINVHALKGATANIGADSLSYAAEKLEKAAESFDLNFIETHNTKFLSDLELLLHSIDQALSTHTDRIEGNYPA
jgi:CheY-like chemotaxis protein